MELKLRVHPLFIIFSFFLIFFGGVKLFFIYFLTLILHELGHYFVAKKLGYKLNSIMFMPYGVSLNGKGNIFKKSDEIFIALAGPFVNVLLTLMCVSMWWFFPELYFYTEEFVYANISLGVFNLLPFFPLDGGRLFVAISSFKLDEIKVVKSMKVVSFIGSLLFLSLFIASVFSTINITFLFVATFLLSSSMDGKKNLYYDRLYKFIKNPNSKPLEVKTYVISKDASLNEIVKLFSGSHYTEVIVVDDNFEIVKTLTESQLMKLLEKK